MRRTFMVLAVVAALALSASAAQAANPHFKRTPTLADQGLVLNAAGALAGLGNADIVVTLTATADPTTACTNKGGNAAPGQNPAEVTVTGSQAIPASAVKNGTVNFSVTTAPPAQPTAAEAGCPSSNWSASITDMTFKTATLTVQQGGAVVLSQTFQL